jgi:hypothetical protein
MTLVYPDADNAAQVAADLLSLVDDPAQVRTNTDNGLAFDVPDAVADEYHRLMADVVPAGETRAPTKRGGRPRKEV